LGVNTSEDRSDDSKLAKTGATSFWSYRGEAGFDLNGYLEVASRVRRGYFGVSWGIYQSARFLVSSIWRHGPARISLGKNLAIRKWQTCIGHRNNNGEENNVSLKIKKPCFEIEGREGLREGVDERELRLDSSRKRYPNCRGCVKGGGGVGGGSVGGRVLGEGWVCNVGGVKNR